MGGERKFTPRKRTREVPKEEPTHKEKFSHIGGSRTLVANGVPCVYLEKGVTKNMGEFNSARVTVGMMLPIDYTDEELRNAKKTLNVIDKVITERLEEEVDLLFEED